MKPWQLLSVSSGKEAVFYVVVKPWQLQSATSGRKLVFHGAVRPQLYLKKVLLALEETSFFIGL